MPKLEIPAHLTESLPKNIWGKVIGATPVVMTVVATCLAGLASNEMIRAQYDRSWAAQLQSKASDEWGYFQAKRLRSILQGDTYDLFQALPPAPDKVAVDLRATDPKTYDALSHPKFPPEPFNPPLDPHIQSALQAVQNDRPEAQIDAYLLAAKPSALDHALRSAQSRLDAFDRTVKPISQWADNAEKTLTASGALVPRALKSLRLRYDQLRYDAESRLDQDIAYVYELQVRHATFTADRHRTRSQSFFFGMLAAQAAVVVSTFALAARQKSLLWSFAACAGLAAVLFALYVYLYV